MGKGTVRVLAVVMVEHVVAVEVEEVVEVML